MLNFNQLSTDTINKILIIVVILLIVELFFSNEGLIFTVVISSLLTYVGWKRYHKLWAKVVFWIGFLLLVITILNTTAFRFLFIAIIIFFLINYMKSQKSPEKLVPNFQSDSDRIEHHESLVKIEPLLQQRLFGDEKTSEAPYEWRDINIHGGFGDRVIDLSNTVLPEEAIISIRHFVGNITIYVPYEIEVNILHSSLLGRITIFGNKQDRLLNQTISYRTEGYYINKPRVKIITSIGSGDIEVKRI